MRKILLFLMILSLCACANHSNNFNQMYSKANKSQVSASAKAKNLSSKPKTQSMPVFKLKENIAAPGAVGETAIKSANIKSTQKPKSSRYINSIMNFDYVAGDLYEVYTAPLCVTDIQFQSGESIVSVGAGDTLRWQVSKTYSGTGSSKQEHLLIKPFEIGLTNSLVVTTDQRTYHMILRSTTDTFMAQVAWHYTDDDGFVENLDNGDISRFDNDISRDGPNSVALDNLDFKYSMKVIRGPKPDWFPRAVFNDGKKTYIKLPPNAQEAPTLFIGNNPKTNQMVNYRVQGNYYVIDSIFSAAQLHSGNQSAIIVQISYVYK